MRKIFTVSFLLIQSLFCSAQHTGVDNEINFANYLILHKYYDNALICIKNMETNYELSNAKKDTLSFLKAKSFYFQQQYDSAKVYFNKISFSDTLIFYSGYYSTLCDIANNTKSEKLFNNIEESSISSFNDYNVFLSSGLNLYNRDTNSFNKALHYSFSNDELSQNFNALVDIKKHLQFKKKSGLLAGVMSAIIPGLGKIYAGKPKQGLTTFLPVTILGLQTFEAYQKGGFNNPWFIVNSALFSVFYIGNIWGSVLSVSVTRNEYNSKINDQILFHLRIPIEKL